MSAGKVVIIVLVAIALLFVVGLAAGSNNHGGTADPNPNAFLGHFQAGKFLQVKGKVTATGCANTSPSVVVVTTSPCTLTVPAGGAFAGATRIAVKPANGGVVVRVIPRGNGPEQSKVVNAGECLGAAFDGKGGSVVVGPSAGPLISVQLLDQRCP
jgi:hypothetical protein